MYKTKQSSVGESFFKFWSSVAGGAGIAGAILLFILVTLLILALLSVGVIWSLNVLFGLEIAYIWETIIAVLILVVAFGGSARAKG